MRKIKFKCTSHGQKNSNSYNNSTYQETQIIVHIYTPFKGNLFPENQFGINGLCVGVQLFCKFVEGSSVHMKFFFLIFTRTRSDITRETLAIPLLVSSLWFCTLECKRTVCKLNKKRVIFWQVRVNSVPIGYLALINRGKNSLAQPSFLLGFIIVKRHYFQKLLALQITSFFLPKMVFNE